jgi:hypothetical protein
MPEEQDVHADHDGYQRDHVEHDASLSSHRPTLPLKDRVAVRCAGRLGRVYGSPAGGLATERDYEAASAFLKRRSMLIRANPPMTCSAEPFGELLDECRRGGGDGAGT